MSHGQQGAFHNKITLPSKCNFKVVKNGRILPQKKKVSDRQKISDRNFHLDSKGRDSPPDSALFLKDQEFDPFFPYFNVNSQVPVDIEFKRISYLRMDFVIYACDVITEIVPGVRWTHEVLAGAIFQNRILVPYYRYYENILTASNQCLDRIPRPGNLLGIQVFDSIDFNALVTNTNQQNMYADLKLQNITVIEEFAAQYKSLIAAGQISVAWLMLPQVSVTEFKLDYDKLFRIAAIYLRKQDFDQHYIENQTIYEQIAEFTGGIREKVQDIFPKGRSVKFQTTKYNPDLTGWKKVPGWKAVQFGSTFYHIPQRCNIDFELTNKIWMQYASSVGWVVVLNYFEGKISGGAGVGVSGAGVGTGISSPFERSAIAAWYIVLDVHNKIEYMPNDPRSQLFGTGYYNLDDIRQYVQNNLDTEIAGNPFGLLASNFKVYVWESGMNESQMDFLLAKISWNQYIQVRK